ncbi:MAG TPA: amino acid ABC transporter permease [Verrucomicrobiae bacterium]|nr:amino acid ABC transporter permease [Verrucomicrobiae bacterium]
MTKSFPILLKGAVLTLELTAAAVAIGTIIGLLMAIARLSVRRWIAWPAAAYVDFFRGTPLLVQIYLIYFGAPQLLQFQPPDSYPYIAGIIALSLNSGAYIAEIFRAGIQSIDRGQTEAARSLGMTKGQAMQFVILPQAFKRVIPPLGNEFIAMLKDSALVSVISIEELLFSGKIIVGRAFKPFEIYISVAVIYLVMTLTISRIVNYMERRLAKGDTR